MLSGSVICAWMIREHPELSFTQVLQDVLISPRSGRSHGMPRLAKNDRVPLLGSISISGRLLRA